jgi:hypothetical protein
MQRYGCPAMGDVVEGRKRTVESVEIEEHWGVRWDCVGGKSGRLVTGLSEFSLENEVLSRTWLTAIGGSR